ncbi:MAG: phosphoglycerate dehydrogenase, partial [Acidimicrobiia bacterium]
MGTKVLVTEEIAPSGLDILRQAGHNVDFRPGIDHRELIEAVCDAAALIVRSGTQVTADVIEAAPALRVIGRAGIGVDNIDVEAATRRGIVVVNAPQSNTLSAAEHTMALMLALCRRIPEADRSMHAGEWKRSAFVGIELADKTLGIVGLGRIGTLVAQRALAFGMRLIAYDPYVSQERARQMSVELVSLEELCERADVITVHLPKTKETVGLINKERIASMKPSVRIVNTARGEIVDEEALATALYEGRIAGAAVDVYSREPPPPDHPLLGAPNTVLTPHLGATTAEAQDKAGKAVAEQVVAVLRGELVPFAVNVEVGREIPELVRAFLPLAEILGSFYTALAGGLTERVDVALIGQLAEVDDRLISVAVLKGMFSAISEEPVSYVNAPLIAKDKGIEVRRSSSAASEDFVSLIRVSGTGSAGSISVAGTLVGPRQAPRIVEIGEHSIDLPPSRYMLIIHNQDKPGVIGRVGTVLGNAGINISNMAVGRDPGGAHAMM